MPKFVFSFRLKGATADQYMLIEAVDQFTATHIFHNQTIPMTKPLEQPMRIMLVTHEPVTTSTNITGAKSVTDKPFQDDLAEQIDSMFDFLDWAHKLEHAAQCLRDIADDLELSEQQSGIKDGMHVVIDSLHYLKEESERARIDAS